MSLLIFILVRKLRKAFLKFGIDGAYIVFVNLKTYRLISKKIKINFLFNKKSYFLKCVFSAIGGAHTFTYSVGHKNGFVDVFFLSDSWSSLISLGQLFADLYNN